MSDVVEELEAMREDAASHYQDAEENGDAEAAAHFEGKQAALLETIEIVKDARDSDGRLVDIDDFFPTDCVLCDNSADTPEEHEQHMEEVHGL